MRRLAAMFAAVMAATMFAAAVMAAALPVAANTYSGLARFGPVRVYDAAFSDIDGHWARQWIVGAYEFGIVGGVGGGRFNPDRYMTAAQAIAVAARIHSLYTGGGTDVHTPPPPRSNPWAAGYIAYAQAEGLIGGEWDAAPDAPVTRAEAVRIWSRVLHTADMPRLNTVHHVPYVTRQTPFFEEIMLFFEAGILSGGFDPYGRITRAEAAAVFMRLVDADARTGGVTYGAQRVFHFAGTGTGAFTDGSAEGASFNLPAGLAADADGAVVIIDTYNNALRMAADGQVRTLAGGWVGTDELGFSRGFYRDGAAADALFNRPTDGVFNADGDLFITDSHNHVIRLLRDGRVYTFSGSERGHADGAGEYARFDTPMAIAVDAQGYLYVADSENNVIRRIDRMGAVSTVAGVPGTEGYANGTADAALFRRPMGIAVSADGRVIYVADTGNHVIRRIENGYVTTFAGVTQETDEDGDPAGGFRDGAADAAVFNLPRGLYLADAYGVLFVADSGNHVIRAVYGNGDTLTVAGTGEPGARQGGLLNAEFSQPAGLLLRGGVLFVADTTNNQIRTVEGVLP